MSKQWAGLNLEIRLFGGWAVTRRGETISALRSRAEQRLLAFLALRAGLQTERDALAATFWPDSSPDRALFYLRRCLSGLRAALGSESDRVVSPSSRTLQLNRDGILIDALAFDEAVERGDDESLKRAVGLYRGPLLPEWTDEWILTERASRERVYLDVLEKLGALARERNSPEQAAEWLRRAVAADPSRETAQRGLFESLAACGNYSEMAQAYRTFRLYLHDELNASPDPETVSLYQRLQSAAREQSGPSKRASRDPAAVPPVRKLPTPLSPLIGRESELEHLSSSLRDNRLLTLTGAGGVGKTRLAIALAELAENDFADGVWFVDLAPLSADAEIGDTVATALGFREITELTIIEALQDRLEQEALLLILDNCEHVIMSAASLVDALATRCSRLKIVATSREALGVPGEVCWRVPSLALPGVRDQAAPGREASCTQPNNERILECASVSLFIDRARRAAPGWTPDASSVDTVAQICIRLDGIPLALELAAARVRVLPVKQLAERLDDRFRLLTSGNRSALPRHQTLQALIDWSYDLLAPKERTMLSRLSVFAGGCSLEAAEVVCRGGEIEEADTLDLLTALVDKSLVIMDSGDEEPHYRILETVREYAAARLMEAGERDSVRDRHLSYFLDLCERAEPELVGSNQSEIHQALERVHDNLRVALDWSRAAAPDIGLRMAAALWRFWYDRGYATEGRERLAAALARETDDSNSEVRANALFGLAGFMYLTDDLDESRRLLEECRAIRAGRGDRRGVAQTMINLSLIAWASADYALARVYIIDCIEFWREIGDRYQLCRSLTSLGVIANEEKDFHTGQEALNEALRITQEIGHPQQGIIVQLNLGNVRLAQGDLEEARRLYNAVLAATHEMRWYAIQVSVLDSIAHLAAAVGDHTRCVTLMGALTEFTRRTGIVLARNGIPATEALLDTMHAVLDDATFNASWARGCKMSPEEAATYALEK